MLDDDDEDNDDDHYHVMMMMMMMVMVMMMMIIIIMITHETCRAAQSLARYFVYCAAEDDELVEGATTIDPAPVSSSPYSSCKGLVAIRKG